EIAALESLMYPAESPTQRPSLGKEPVAQRASRPTVLFVWGRSRVLPVRLVELSIQETLFNPGLNPIRVVIDVKLEVLSSVDSTSNAAVMAAMGYTSGKRTALAKLYLA